MLLIVEAAAAMGFQSSKTHQPIQIPSRRAGYICFFQIARVKAAIGGRSDRTP
jgi:hypothetical protein